MTTTPSLGLEPEQGSSGQVAVCVRRLDGVTIRHLLAFRDGGGSMSDVLRVTVGSSELGSQESITHVAGRHEVLEDGIRFRSFLPFERALGYMAIFDTAPFPQSSAGGPRTLEFSLPCGSRLETAKVSSIYPSGDCLPENLLRFYITFANGMQRGLAEREIRIVGSEGVVAPDVLYRAPVELWDKDARTLTILLDPGRLKRGVGPHRTLGPPLSTGRSYMLVVGAGMTNVFGRQLGRALTKRFQVSEAVRTAVSPAEWKISTPCSGSLAPLTIDFPRPLDWAAVFNSFTVKRRHGNPVTGMIATDQEERRWLFRPERPWVAGSYELHVDPLLEDVCGNDLIAPFDRPISTDFEQPYSTPVATLRFDITHRKPG